MAISSTPESFLRGARPVHRATLRRPIRARALLPDLEPAQPMAAPERGPIAQAVVALRRRVTIRQAALPSQRPEARDPRARLLVYILNTALLFVAFPIGFALLLFNILGGENLRATANVIAITGVAMFMMMLFGADPLFGI